MNASVTRWPETSRTAIPAVRWQRSRFCTTSLRPLSSACSDAPFEIEPLLEIDVDQVIAADDAVQGERAAVDVEP